MASTTTSPALMLVISSTRPAIARGDRPTDEVVIRDALIVGEEVVVDTEQAESFDERRRGAFVVEHDEARAAVEHLAAGEQREPGLAM